MENINEFLETNCFWYKKKHIMNQDYHSLNVRFQPQKSNIVELNEFMVIVKPGKSARFKYALESFDKDAKIEHITDVRKKVLSSISLENIAFTSVESVKQINSNPSKTEKFNIWDVEDTRNKDFLKGDLTIPKPQTNIKYTGPEFDIQSVARHHGGIKAIKIEMVDYKKIKPKFSTGCLKDFAPRQEFENFMKNNKTIETNLRNELLQYFDKVFYKE